MDIRIIGKPKSKAVKRIIKNSNVDEYTKKCDVVINYGLVGTRFNNFAKKYPSILKKLIINKNVGHSKYDMIQAVKKKKIVVPESYLVLPKDCTIKDFISKKFFSQGGEGIAWAKIRKKRENRYYQKFIKNRVYELRIHGFLWMEKLQWLVQKKFGDKDKIAWNYNKGGIFQIVKNSNAFNEAKDITEKVLKLSRMSFGAVDFIVDNTNNLFFLEINSSPGFKELSEGWYIKSFNKLTELSKKHILKYCK